MGSVRPSDLLLAALVAVAATGCAPSCDSVCDKLIECGTADGLNEAECVETCSRQQLLYDLDNDRTLEQAFADHRRCIGQATCDEIDDGVCYDEDLFPF